MKVTSLEQIKEIDLENNNVFYIYGKIGSGKSYFSKKLMQQNNKKAYYTTFDEIISNISNELYIANLLGKDFIVIDDGIKKILNKELTCITVERRLKEIQDRGIRIIVLSSVLPEEIKQENKKLIEFVLSGEKIEVCYDIENRIKIAKEYCEECKATINDNTLRAIAKEENLGKIRGKINQISII